ncbi:hypothetical protein [Saccharothrix tamanrassetensis]|nr:hypothetical protein [Saccharothrix tamanrassetensis]
MDPVLHSALAYLAGLLLLVGAGGLLLTMEEEVGGEELMCGSAVTGLHGSITYDPHGERAAEVPVHKAVCEKAISTRRAWAWPVTVLGVLMTLGLVLAVPFVHPQPTWWSDKPPWGGHR